MLKINPLFEQILAHFPLIENEKIKDHGQGREISSTEKNILRL